MEKEIRKFLNNNKLKFLETDNDIQLDCFMCSDTRSRLGISRKSGAWHCFSCNKSGKKLKSLVYGIKNKEVISKDNESVPEKKTTIKPNAHLVFHKKLFKKKYKTLSYLTDVRSISKKTAKHFKLGARSVFKAKDGTKYSKGEHLAIPYIVDGKCVNFKYRNLDPNCEKGTKWAREAGGISALYNQDILNNLDYEYLIITESEIDTLSLYELGFKNTVGLTVGAKGFKQDWYDKLLRFKKIYLVLDNDKVGQEGAEMLAKRLGLGRCFNVLLPEDVKDPNDFIKKYDKNTFKKLLAKGTKFQVRGSRSLRSMMEKSIQKRFYESENDMKGSYNTPWKKVNEVLGPVRDGHLFVLCGKPKSGKCLHGASTVIDGATGVPVTIKHAVENKLESCISYNMNSKKFEVAKISDYHSVGEKPMVEVESSLRTKITASTDHKFLTYAGWKKISDLSAGDYIGVPSKVPFFGKTSIGLSKCFILGGLIADGGLTGSTPNYTKKDDVIVKNFKYHMSNVFDVNFTPWNKYGYRLCNNTKSKRNPLQEWVEELEINKLSKHKELPEILYSVNRMETIAFLSALFTHDSSIYTSKGKGWCFEYGSASEKLVNGVSHLLLKLGVISRITFRKVKCKGKLFDYWRLTVAQNNGVIRLKNVLNLVGPKADVFNSIPVLENKKDSTHVYPKEMDKYVRECIVEAGYKHKDFLSSKVRQISRIKIIDINKIVKSSKLDEIIKSHLVFSKIRSIKDVGYQKCYDITVPKNSNFLANNFIVHNSTLCIKLMDYWTQQGINCGMYSCEMNEISIADKFTMMKNRAAHSIDEITETETHAAMAKIAIDRMFFYYPERSELKGDNESIEKACTVIEEMVQRYGIRVFVFDNLHFLCRGENDKALLDIATQQFKLLAEQLGILIILVAHPRKTNSNKQLTTADMKGSSSIYQDADVVWLMFRKELDGDVTPDEVDGDTHGSMSERADISITGRWTEGGNCFLAFDGKHSDFRDKGAVYKKLVMELKNSGKRKRGI